MTRYTLNDFVAATTQKDRGQGLFELESPRMLEVNLNGMIWTKTGAMKAYVGQVKFEREGVFEHGIGKFFKKALTGEGTRLTKATGQGALYLADEGKSVQILQLHGESIFVNGSDLLAFEPSLKWDITIMRKLSAMLAGGLFNVKLEGHGLLAITTHHEPLTLLVQPGRPVRTDPNATVAWSGTLTPEFKTDMSLKTFFGRGSGESFQMEFNGQGFVVIQPFEERPLQAAQAGAG
ncbi:MAG: AIM24 family protein [Pirellulaceae bacterium]